MELSHCPIHQEQTSLLEPLYEVKQPLPEPSYRERLRNTYLCTHPTKVYTAFTHQLSNQSITYLPLITTDLFVITNPRYIHAILKHPRLSEGQFISEGRQLRVIADALGKFRLNQEKADIKPKRNVMTHLLMHPHKYFPMLFSLTDELFENWSKALDPLVVTSSISEYTLKIFLSPVMNYEGPWTILVKILEEQIDLLGHHLIERTPAHFQQRFLTLRDQLCNYLYPDKTETTQKTEYTKRLTDYIEQHHQTYKNEAFATGVNSGVLAGYLAPNPAFIATVYELGLHEDWQIQLREEWEKAKKQDLSREDYILKEDTLLHAVMHEILRLHPSQPFLFRQAAQDLMIDKKYILTKNSDLIIDLFHFLRNKTHWGEDANQFNPRRFLNNSTLYQTPFLVYSTGPNNCTGQIFSKLTLKIFIQSLCSKFTWKTLNKNVKHKFHFAMTLDQDISVMLKHISSYP